MLSIQTILHPTDFSERSDFAFRIACSLARDYGARLIVLHVAEPPTVVGGEGMAFVASEADLGALRKKLEQLKPRAPKVPMDFRLVEGVAVNEILDLARETKCNLIVMGTHGRTGLRRLLMGSVAEFVVRNADCPVLTVKSLLPDSPSKDIPVLEAVTSP